MARLYWSGAEFGNDTEEGGIDHTSDFGAGTFSYDTTTKRSGAYAWKFDAGASNQSPLVGVNYASGVAGRSYYQRGYLLIPSATGYPTAAARVMLNYRFSANADCCVTLSTTGTVQLGFGGPGASLVGSASPVLPQDVWHRIETRVKIVAGSADDELQFLVNGTELANVTGQTIDTSTPSRLEWGWHDQPGANKVIYWDDVALNDDQGSTSHTSWCGPENIVLLKPISHNSIGTWTGGVGGTSNLQDAIDNVPPAGLSIETDTSQIENAQNTASAPGDFNMTSYTSAGLPAGGKASVVRLRVVHAEDITTGTATGSCVVVSNPAQGSASTFTFGDDSATTMADFPTGWARHNSTELYDQVVDAATSPVARVTKTTSSTKVGSVCQLVMHVAYVPSLIPPESTSRSLIQQTVYRL